MTIKLLTAAKSTYSGGGVAQATSPLGASDTGFNFVNDGKTSILIKNGSASTITCTVNAQAKYQGFSLQNPTFSILAGASKLLPFLDPTVFNDGSGKCQIDIVTAAITVEGQAISY